MTTLPLPLRSVRPALPTVPRDVVRTAAALGAYAFAFGVSYGAVASAAGLGVVATLVSSIVMNSGASQFAFVGVLAAGGSPFAGGLTATLLGTRNAFYGLRMAPLLAWRGAQRAAAAQLLLDETTAMALNRQAPQGARLGFLSTGLSILVLWNSATLVGALAGTTLGDPRRLGLDAMVAAAFLALLWPQVRGTRAGITVVSAAALAASLVPASPAGVPVLGAVGVALLAGALPPTPTGRHTRPRRPPGAVDLPARHRRSGLLPRRSARHRSREQR